MVHYKDRDIMVIPLVRTSLQFEIKPVILKK
jgi:hypothetical protein